MEIDPNTTDTTETHTGGGATDGQSQDKTQTFTQADIDRIVADRLSRERSKFSDYDDLKKQAKRLADIEASQLSETEKRDKRIKELEDQLKEEADNNAAIVAQANQRLINSALIAEATALNFHKPEDAPRFVDMAGLSVDESGNVTGAKDAIKALAKERAYLVKTATAPDINGGSRTASKQTEAAARVEDVKRRFRLKTPG